MIAELSQNEVIAYCRSFFGVDTDTVEISDELLAEMLRRTAGFMCPCSRSVLRTAVVECLSYLHPDSDALSIKLEQLIQDMLVVGDLLELADVTTEEDGVKGTWVFPSPPSYVVRRNGSVFLTGISPDYDKFLPEDLNVRIIHSRVTRQILPKPGEQLSERLGEQGLNHLSEAVWLKSPKDQSPERIIAQHLDQLRAQTKCGEIVGLEILDHSTKVTYYRGRWCVPVQHTGMFIARRPQEYGAPLWCFVDLDDGQPKHVVDFPPRNYRWRGCDAAWRLQLAIDFCEGHPQKYRRTTLPDSVRFDFFSPLPLWAQRRLMIFGQERPPEKSLFAYEIPFAEAIEEENNLKKHLWLQEADLR